MQGLNEDTDILYEDSNEPDDDSDALEIISYPPHIVGAGAASAQERFLRQEHRCFLISEAAIAEPTTAKLTVLVL